MARGEGRYLRVSFAQEVGAPVLDPMLCETVERESDRWLRLRSAGGARAEYVDLERFRVLRYWAEVH